MQHEQMLAWADRHLNGLEDSIARFITEKNPYPLVTEYDHVTGEYVIRLRVRPDAPQPHEWAFRIGDTLHSLRVALDYLAFRIVTRNDPTANIDKVAFPICEKAANYPSVEGRCLQSAPVEVKQIIESLQPYHGRHGERLEPLFVLDALENVHKHRHLLDAGPAITSVGGAGIGLAKLKISRCLIPEGPLKDGTEVYRYVFVDPNETEVDVQFRVQTHICFDKKGPARGQIVLTALKEIRDHIRNDIFGVLEPFL